MNRFFVMCALFEEEKMRIWGNHGLESLCGFGQPAGFGEHV